MVARQSPQRWTALPLGAIFALLALLAQGGAASGASTPHEYREFNSVCVEVSLKYQGSAPIEVDRDRVVRAFAPKLETALRAAGIPVPVLPGPGCQDTRPGVPRRLMLRFTTLVAALPEARDLTLVAILHVAKRWDYSTGTLGTEPRVFVCPRADAQALEACLAEHVSTYFERVILPVIKISWSPNSRGSR
ncbi:MAG TPA: hypothetical protein VF744_15965 [Beijerinckiaceae bacterium]|jgi:hypothetical protein